MAGVVIMMLIAATTRVREASVEQLSIYSAKSHALDMADWLEDDIGTLGSNFDSTTVRFLAPTIQDGNTVDFTFLRDSIGAAPQFNNIRIETRYRLEPTELAVLKDTTVQMFQMIRSHRTQQGAGWTGWKLSANW